MTTNETGGRFGLSRWWLTIGAIATLLILAAVTPSPYTIEQPGPVVNTFGQITTDAGEVDVVRVSGTETYDTDGELNVLSVSIIGTPEQRASWLTVATSLFDQSRSIVPTEEVFPVGITSDQRDAYNAALMVNSQSQATAAALNELGTAFSGTVTVVSVSPDGPVEGVLREGDQVVLANGESVRGIGDLRAAVAANGAETEMPLVVMREGEKLTVSVVPAVPAGGDTPMLGLGANTEFRFPYDIELELDRIGGPSAGLIFALAVYDALTPGALTRGLTVSGTGTIDENGSVGVIGGLEQKLWGAAGAGSDLMLMPLANCPDLPEQRPEGLRIVPVETLAEAIAAIETVAAGGEPEGVESCPG